MTKKPSYRFAGYTEPWEQRKLGECTEISAGGDIEKSKLLNNGKYPVIANALTSDGIVGYYNDSYRIEAPAVTVTGRGDVGVAKARNVNFTPVVRLLSLKSEHDVIFLENAINTQKIVIESTGVPQLTAPQLGRYKIFFPSLPEQTAIGSFFQDIDQLISLQQRKLEVLKEQKKTYLKLLFPAKGQTKPALRFAGFEDDWKRKNFGDFLVEFNEKTIVENQHELLSSTNNGIEPRKGRVSGESNIGYKVLKKDMIVLSPQNLWLGNINYNVDYESGIVSPSYKIFNVLDIDKKFISILIRHPYMNYEYGQASVQGASVVRRNLDIDLFNTIQILLPSLEEQTLIGSFFLDLDKAIAKQEEKVKNLKESKQTLLRKMFI